MGILRNLACVYLLWSGMPIAWSKQQINLNSYLQHSFDVKTLLELYAGYSIKSKRGKMEYD